MDRENKNAGLVRGGLLFSELLRFRVVDRAGAAARLRDIAIDPTVGEFPRVTCLIYRVAGQDRHQLWDAVRPYWRYGRFEVDDLTGEPFSEASELVLLRRDVLDASLIDTEHLQITRANDLWLHQLDAQLYLGAVDTSAVAVIRRIARGLLGHGAPKGLLDWKNVEYLRGKPELGAALADYHGELERLQPGVLARLAEDMPYLEAAEMLVMLPDWLAARTFEAMVPAAQLQVFQEIHAERRIAIVSLMASDAAADVLGMLGAENVSEILQKLPKQALESILALLRYPADSAGGVMTNQILRLPANCTAGKARLNLGAALDGARFYQVAHLVDPAGCLVGTMTLQEFLLAPDTAALASLARAPAAMALPLEPARQVASRLIDRQLLSIPVLAPDRRLIGAVTLDAAIAVMAPESWRSQAPRVFS